MSKKKNYLISLFLKCSQYLSSANQNLKINEDFLRASYQSVNSDDFNEVIQKNGIDRFVEEMTFLVDSHFSEREVESLIEFFRSDVGKKLVDKDYLLKIQKLMNKITTDRQKQVSRMEKG